MRALLSVLLLVAAFLLACTGDTAVKDLQQSTEHIHDEAMKEMAVMNRLGRELKKELAAIDSTAANPRREALVSALSAMRLAEEDMMNWMVQYKEPTGMEKDAALQYLQTQKTKIEKNQSDIRAATEMGKRLQSAQ
jgi:thioredoxin-related protein